MRSTVASVTNPTGVRWRGGEENRLDAELLPRGLGDPAGRALAQAHEGELGEAHQRSVEAAHERAAAVERSAQEAECRLARAGGEVQRAEDRARPEDVVGEEEEEGVVGARAASARGERARLAQRHAKRTLLGAHTREARAAERGDRVTGRGAVAAVGAPGGDEGDEVETGEIADVAAECGGRAGRASEGGLERREELRHAVVQDEVVAVGALDAAGEAFLACLGE